MQALGCEGAGTQEVPTSCLQMDERTSDLLCLQGERVLRGALSMLVGTDQAHLKHQVDSLCDYRANPGPRHSMCKTLQQDPLP